MTPPVLTKNDFTRRYRVGEFGNHSPTWDTFAEFAESGYEGGPIHLRNRVAAGPTVYDIEPGEAAERYQELLNQGVKPSDVYVSAMAPTHLTLFQGEVQCSPRHFDLYYTTVRKPMRDALREWARQVYGVEAALLLQYYLCSRSYEWLLYLLDTYPGHVVEFSTYERCWGTEPGYNTVFWEVRSY